MKKLTFEDRLFEIGEQAKDHIRAHMDGKDSVWLPGYVHDEDNEDIEVDEDWPTFDNESGDLNSLVGFDRDEAGEVRAWAILQMRHEPEELQSYSLHNLPAEALCNIADSLPIPFAIPNVWESCLQNILNAHANMDSTSMEEYIRDAKELLRDPE